MPIASINGTSLFYETHGQGEPLVLIAGFGADHTAWRLVVDILKNKYRVIVFDNRGAGRSGVPAGSYTIEQMADDAAALCGHLRIDRAHFIGNSMGGYILQMLAYRHPSLLKSAIISNSTFITHTCFHVYVDAQFELLKSRAPLPALIKASCAWVYSYQFLSQPGVLDKLIQLGVDNPYPFTLEGYFGQCAALNGFDSRSWVHQIEIPTLVVGADQDLIFQEPTIKALAAKIPSAGYVSFSECGHLPFIEYPEKFASMVSEFIDKSGTI